jgi:hypothetical protein
MRYFQTKVGLFIATLILISSHCFSQDTIYYKNATRSIVIVKEVSPKEVQYKKIEMPDGPTYIVSKDEIEKIVYKNGYAEVIKAPVAETPSQPLTITYSTPISSSKPTITYSDTKLKYSKLNALIDRHPDESVKPTLIGYQRSMRNLKAGQDATRTVAIVFGGITIATGALTALIYSVDSYAGENFAVVPAVAGGIAVITGAAAIAFNINLKKKRHAFVDLYNK